MSAILARSFQTTASRSIPSLASRAFTYPLFGPLFFLVSSYVQSCERRAQVAHAGRAPSHRSFLFLHSTHAMRLDFGCCSLGARLEAGFWDRSLKYESSGDWECECGSLPSSETDRGGMTRNVGGGLADSKSPAIC